MCIYYPFICSSRGFSHINCIKSLFLKYNIGIIQEFYFQMKKLSGTEVKWNLPIHRNRRVRDLKGQDGAKFKCSNNVLRIPHSIFKL